jgi:type VI secretion system protein VasD
VKTIHTLPALMLLALTGCGSAPVVEPPPPPVVVSASVAAAVDSNPDAGGRASPLVVRLYELADAEAFRGADFFALWNQEAPVLAAALVKRHEFVVAPGTELSRGLTLDPKVQVIGVAAAFRDIRNANWRTVVPVAPAEQGPRALKLEVVAAGTSLAATIGEDSAAPAAGTERKENEKK